MQPTLAQYLASHSLLIAARSGLGSQSSNSLPSMERMQKNKKPQAISPSKVRIILVIALNRALCMYTDSLTKLSDLNE